MKPNHETQPVKKMARIVAWVTVLLWSGLVLAQSSVFYRYVDNKGVTVISSKIPARFVPKGYDVITKEGRLIERVPPELSPEEKARLERERIARERQEKRDNELLRRYSHPDDIEAAKQRKLAQNRNTAGIIERNLEKVEDEINYYQGLAANEERAGKVITPETLERIEQLKRDKEIELKRQDSNQQERQQIIEKYDSDIARFNVIRPLSSQR